MHEYEMGLIIKTHELMRLIHGMGNCNMSIGHYRVPTI